MKFYVTRTSQWGGCRPCPEANGKIGEWYVEFSTLEELMFFVEKRGDVIVSKYMSIEIYDGYRE
jgi:hypothetical protein